MRALRRPSTARARRASAAHVLRRTCTCLQRVVHGLSPGPQVVNVKASRVRPSSLIYTPYRSLGERSVARAYFPYPSYQVPCYSSVLFTTLSFFFYRKCAPYSLKSFSKTRRPSPQPRRSRQHLRACRVISRQAVDSSAVLTFSVACGPHGAIRLWAEDHRCRSAGER